MGLLDRIRGRRAPEREAPSREGIALAFTHFEHGRADAAGAICEAILADAPDDAAALHLLGLVAGQNGDAARAIDLIGQAVRLDPAEGLYQLNLANALRVAGRTEDALPHYVRAAMLSPERYAAWLNLGQLRAERGEAKEAIAALRRALQVAPGNGAARLALASALLDAVKSSPDGATASAEAVSLLEAAWEETPEPSRAGFLLSKALANGSRWTEAVAHLEALTAAHPEIAELHNTLANCYSRLGRAVEAIREYRATFRLAPDFHHALTSVLGTLNAVPDVSREDVLAAHREWAESVAAPLYPGPRRFANSRDRERRLRVGYVSPDLRRHPVGTMFAPILERHDPARIETFCYYNYPRADLMTERMRRAAHHWRDIAALDDDAVARLVEQDGIDILVDLVGHTQHTRLPVFARKPAPVQVSWLGYFNTTGLATMDYFVTDPTSSPAGQDAGFVEKLVRLPATRFCFEPPEYMPEVNALPAARHGCVTFACLNNIAKLNTGVLDLWARILKAVPDSRLLLQASALGDPLFQRHFRAAAERHGIPSERIEFRRFVPVEQAALTYHEVDVALDPFPFCGGMTSLDALWMGVPVVTLPQAMIAGRQTASMLVNLAMPELIARDEADYVAIAVDLARDRNRLAAIRSGLRERFRNSPLVAYERFTRDLEDAYRAMWHAWVAT